jgi:hypothetical protein
VSISFSTVLRSFIPTACSFLSSCVMYPIRHSHRLDLTHVTHIHSPALHFPLFSRLFRTSSSIGAVIAHLHLSQSHSRFAIGILQIKFVSNELIDTLTGRHTMPFTVVIQLRHLNLYGFQRLYNNTLT